MSRAISAHWPLKVHRLPAALVSVDEDAPPAGISPSLWFFRRYESPTSTSYIFSSTCPGCITGRLPYAAKLGLHAIYTDFEALPASWMRSISLQGAHPFPSFLDPILVKSRDLQTCSTYFSSIIQRACFCVTLQSLLDFRHPTSAEVCLQSFLLPEGALPGFTPSRTWHVQDSRHDDMMLSRGWMWLLSSFIQRPNTALTAHVRWAWDEIIEDIDEIPLLWILNAEPCGNAGWKCMKLYES